MVKKTAADRREKETRHTTGSMICRVAQQLFSSGGGTATLKSVTKVPNPAGGLKLPRPRFLFLMPLHVFVDLHACGPCDQRFKKATVGENLPGEEERLPATVVF